MAFWKKKKRMIDVAELQKRGNLRVPKNDIDVPTDSNGFVEFTDSKTIIQETTTPTTEKSDSSSIMGFFDTTPSDSPTTSDSEFSTEANGYSRREVDARMEEIDNKIYKLEQRIELLERKAGL